MTLAEALRQLKALGDPRVRAQNARGGAGDNQFGVRHGDIRRIAARIKADHELALGLWKTGNVDAQQLAALLFEPGKLSSKEMERLVKTSGFSWTADWLISYVLKKHAGKEALREKWMTAKDRWLARAGWSLTAGRIARGPEGLDPSALLDRIEAEMPNAAPEAQWTMNMTLAEIGIHVPRLRRRAVAIGEAIGLYRDWPQSKGCTIPYAPVWIGAMVRRKG